MKRSFIERVKQVMSIVICVALVAAMAPAEIAMAGTGSYEGTQQNDFAGYTPVSTKEELNNIRYDLSGKYYLTRDIVFSEEDFLPEGLLYNAGKGWIPIGDSDSAFSGVIDGNGHTISGLEIIESPAKGSCSGFIGINSGEIINLCIDNYSTAATSSQEAVGTIVGRNSKSGTIKGCINKSSVTGRLNDSTISYTGGVVGWNAGNIINCSNMGYVTGGTKFSQGGCVGGIAGYNEGIIKECYNDGDVQNGGIGGSSATTGGITGKDAGGAICDSYNIATIIGAGSGSNRYETNLTILTEAGVTDEDMLICSGTGFADSLSASAVGKPIMLVGDSLTPAQKTFLGKTKKRTNYIIGGTGAVCQQVENQLNDYGLVDRVSGSNRYTTSTEVASKFFPSDECPGMVLAYGLNFPDGLAGGPLAMMANAPLVLVSSGDTAAAAEYAEKTNITEAVVLGGPGLISDKAVKIIIE